jgi:hypothetical protein
VLLVRASTKGMCRRVAPDADQVACLLHHAHTPRLPRTSELVVAMSERTEWVGTLVAASIPAQRRLECEALVAHVPLLATSKAHDTWLVVLDEGGDCVCIHRHVYFPSQNPRGVQRPHAVSAAASSLSSLSSSAPKKSERVFFFPRRRCNDGTELDDE